MRSSDSLFGNKRNHVSKITNYAGMNNVHMMNQFKEKNVNLETLSIIWETHTWNFNAQSNSSKKLPSD